ncbi:unnamed protein product [Brassica oleracea var. botrytis]
MVLKKKLTKLNVWSKKKLICIYILYHVFQIYILQIKAISNVVSKNKNKL